MPPSTRRRGASPDAAALDEITQTPPIGGRLRKAHPVDPVVDTGTSTTRDPGEPGTGPAGGQRSTPARSGRAPAPTAGKVKVGFYQDPDDTARARAAYDWTRPHERHRSFSDFVAAAVMREVARLETRYNHGKPWPPLEPGQLPTGKPLGS